MRACMWDQPDVSSHLLGVAQARLKRFVHLGTTDLLFESVTSSGVSHVGMYGRLSQHIIGGGASCELDPRVARFE